MVEGIIGFSDMLSIAQTIGLVGTMILTLIFSKKHIQSLSTHQQTRVLNDLDEKVRKMAEHIIEKPSMQSNIQTRKAIRRDSICILCPVDLFSRLQRD